MNKKGQTWIIFVVILIILILAFVYVLFPRGLGIAVSCENFNITGIKKLAPPLLSIYAPETKCLVSIEVKDIDDVKICSQDKIKIRGDEGIIECENLKNYKGKQVKIDVNFFDNNEQGIGFDDAMLIVPS